MMKDLKKIIQFLIFSFLFIAIDWLTKYWAKLNLFYIQSRTYLNGIFTLDYAENNGAALSFGSKLPANQAFWVLQIFPMLILLTLLCFVFMNIKHLSIFKIIFYSATISGGIANLIDRFLNNRHVIDFMIIELGWFKTGIFNFADIFISLGVIGLLFSYFKDAKDY